MNVVEKVEQLIEKANVNGIKFLEVDAYGNPIVAEYKPFATPSDEFGSTYLFANYNTNGNGGMYPFLREVYLPDGYNFFSNHMFANCTKLEKINGDFSEVIQISFDCFLNCRSLTEMPYFPKVSFISLRAFKGCTGLTSVTFPNTVTGITSSAFEGCTNITDIYCPWSEGEVANAPWGATNATIHYNYNAEV